MKSFISYTRFIVGAALVIVSVFLSPVSSAAGGRWFADWFKSDNQKAMDAARARNGSGLTAADAIVRRELGIPTPSMQDRVARAISLAIPAADCNATLDHNNGLADYHFRRLLNHFPEGIRDKIGYSIDNKVNGLSEFTITLPVALNESPLIVVEDVNQPIFTATQLLMPQIYFGLVVVITYKN